MIFFEEGLDEYLEQTSLFPHSAIKGNDKMAIKANPITAKAQLKCIYLALGLTARGTLRKTAAERRIEKLIGRQRG